MSFNGNHVQTVFFRKLNVYSLQDGFGWVHSSSCQKIGVFNWSMTVFRNAKFVKTVKKIRVVLQYKLACKIHGILVLYE